jgi:hypothetical protein
LLSLSSAAGGCANPSLQIIWHGVLMSISQRLLMFHSPHFMTTDIYPLFHLRPVLTSLPHPQAFSELWLGLHWS